MSLNKVASSRTVTVLMLAVFLMSAVSVISSRPTTAQSQPLVVRITIERVTAIDEDGVDCHGGADFYAKGWIDGDYRGQSAVIDDDDDIFPNWEFSKLVDLASGSVTARLEIWEDDNIFCGDNDQMDINPDSGEMGIDVSITLSPCSVETNLPSGSFDQTCGATIRGEGTGEEATAIEFRVEVTEPVSTENLRIRCFHRPIWPQPGEAVTIDAAIDSANNSVTQADSIEIWLDDTVAPVASDTNTGMLSHTTPPLFGSTFSYRCRAVVDGIPVSSGWRVVTIGEPADDQAVPVLFTGPRSSRLDIVFIADAQDLGSPDVTPFLQKVYSEIRSIYSEDVFLRNQDMFNFWIALGTGDADDKSWGCRHDGPNISWMDAGVIIHTAGSSFRDCADLGDRLFSSSTQDLATSRTVVHELGHVPFGLADEYPGDGGYFQTEMYPNVYHRLDSWENIFQREVIGCEVDAPSLGRTAEDCHKITHDISWWFDEDWFVSDPETNDLMRDNGMAQGSDIRRIEWVLSHCRAGNC